MPSCMSKKFMDTIFDHENISWKYKKCMGKKSEELISRLRIFSYLQNNKITINIIYFVIRF